MFPSASGRWIFETRPDLPSAVVVPAGDAPSLEGPESVRTVVVAVDRAHSFLTGLLAGFGVLLVVCATGLCDPHTGRRWLPVVLACVSAAAVLLHARSYTDRRQSTLLAACSVAVVCRGVCAVRDRRVDTGGDVDRMRGHAGADRGGAGCRGGDSRPHLQSDVQAAGGMGRLPAADRAVPAGVLADECLLGDPIPLMKPTAALRNCATVGAVVVLAAAPAVWSAPAAWAIAPPTIDPAATPADGPPSPPEPMRQGAYCTRVGTLPGTDYRVQPHYMDMLDLPDAWQFGRGAGVTVAVIDTGVSPHPRLPNLVGGGDYVGDSDGLQDCDAHGTFVASIIGAAPLDGKTPLPVPRQTRRPDTVPTTEAPPPPPAADHRHRAGPRTRTTPAAALHRRLPSTRRRPGTAPAVDYGCGRWICADRSPSTTHRRAGARSAGGGRVLRDRPGRADHLDPAVLAGLQSRRMRSATRIRSPAARPATSRRWRGRSCTPRTWAPG